jgi:NAD(P)-dependent dehydrogenase (short-subunit alcohol dehydrogenase family)
MVMIGSGPGIGLATSKLFASKGFNIALIARSADRLKDDAAQVQAAAKESSVKVEIFPVDVTDHAAFRSALADVHKKLGAPEVVIYNAARVGPSEFGKFTPEEMLQDYRLNAVGIYVAAVWALPYLEQVAKNGGKPSFFLSGSGVSYRPLPPVFSLSMMKAAQGNFLKSFEHWAAPKGVHVAHLHINGSVSDEEPVRTAQNIAEAHWALYQQDKADWQSTRDVGDMEQYATSLGF